MTSDQESLSKRAVSAILREILDGSRPDSGWLLNPGDNGILRSLDALSAEEASTLGPGNRSSVAAHAEHLRYGLGLLNRWARGENPWADADWRPSWQHVRVSASEWEALREGLRKEARQWESSLATRIADGEEEITTVFASVAHLAYHLGAIRQIALSARGPAAND